MFSKTSHPYDCGHILIGNFPRTVNEYDLGTIKILTQALSKYIKQCKETSLTMISCSLTTRQQPMRDILRKLGFKKTPDKITNKYKDSTICIYYWENPKYLQELE